MKDIMILNLTRQSFFRCTPKTQNKILRELTTNYDQSILTEENGCSHWDKTDHIVFVPQHLMEHVDKYYGELYI